MKYLIPLLIATILAGCSPSANYALSPLAVPPPTYSIYLPSTFGKAIPTMIPRPTATATPSPCYLTPQAATFARLLAEDSRQERPSLRCHPALVRAAQVRAESMAKWGYFNHCDPNGVCPNPVARAQGCRLPADYSLNGNNIESILAGTADPDLTWRLLSASPKHAPHLLGQGDFFGVQRDIGVAFVDAPGSKYSFYWVVLIGVCGASGG